jgi:hypothetical protein
MGMTAYNAVWLSSECSKERRVALAACTPETNSTLPCVALACCAAGHGNVWLFRRQRQGPDHPPCAAVVYCSTHHTLSACSARGLRIAAAPVECSAVAYKKVSGMPASGFLGVTCSCWEGLCSFPVTGPA